MINQFTIAAKAIKSALPTFKSVKTAQRRTETAKSVFEQIRADKKRKEKEYKEARRAVSRKAAKANQRLKKLEEQGLEFSPAYRKAFENNPTRFGVRGIRGLKELLREDERIDKFLGSKTSKIRGVKKYLEEIAEKRGQKIGRGEHHKFAVKNSNMFRAHERMVALRDKEFAYISDEEMNALNSVIEELDDGHAYSIDEIDAVANLAIELETKKHKAQKVRRHMGITKAKPVVLSTNKADPIDLDW